MPEHMVNIGFRKTHNYFDLSSVSEPHKFYMRIRIRIQDPENVHTDPDPGKILSVINLQKPNVTVS